MNATATKLPTPPHHYAKRLEEAQAENVGLEAAVTDLMNRLDGQRNITAFLHREIDALTADRRAAMLGWIVAGTVNGVAWAVLIVWLFG